MMKRTVKLLIVSIISCLLVSYMGCVRHKPHPDLLLNADHIRSSIKHNALYADSINWVILDEELKTLQWTGSDSLDQELLLRFFTRQLRQAGDRHSHLYSRRAITSVLQNLVPEEPRGINIGENIGLISVPAFGSFDTAQDVVYANKITRAVRVLDTKEEINGWIVDLRQNHGGSMWPMLAGLSALVNDRPAGYFLSKNLTRPRPWQNKIGELYPTGQVVDAYKIKNPNTKIAVLIDSMTASSGEFTAICFMGLPNTKLFGQPTRGLTTTNVSIKISEDITLSLAVGYAANRYKQPIRGKIIPDVIVPHTGGSDNAIQAAKVWLLDSNVDL